MLPTHYPAHLNAATPLSNADAQALAKAYGAYGGVRKGAASPEWGIQFSIYAVLVSILAPWAMFCFMTWAHALYSPGGVQILLSLLAMLVICGVAYLSLRAWLARQQQSVKYARWLTAIAMMSLLSWGVGFAIGDKIYGEHMRDHADLVLLNDYKGVDPMLQNSQMFMDAGRIEFIEGSHIDDSKSMSFKSDKTYCAAPIVGPTKSPWGDLYSFWAVGTDCCSAKGADFTCGAFSDPKARSGVRVVHNDEKDFYRLAVRQAESEYNIKASHPVFYHWTRNAAKEIARMNDDGVRQLVNYMFTWFAWQLFATVLCMFLLGWWE